jgi:hypothetical protein
MESGGLLNTVTSSCLQFSISSKNIIPPPNSNSGQKSSIGGEVEFGFQNHPCTGICYVFAALFDMDNRIEESEADSISHHLSFVEVAGFPSRLERPPTVS